jgi:hypothetical protein
MTKKESLSLFSATNIFCGTLKHCQRNNGISLALQIERKKEIEFSGKGFFGSEHNARIILLSFFFEHAKSHKIVVT